MSKDNFARVLAERVIKARGERSQQQLAELLGTTQSTYSKWEKRGRKQKPSMMPHEYIKRFCDVTNTDPRDLLGY